MSYNSRHYRGEKQPDMNPCTAFIVLGLLGFGIYFMVTLAGSMKSELQEQVTRKGYSFEKEAPTWWYLFGVILFLISLRVLGVVFSGFAG